MNATYLSLGFHLLITRLSIPKKWIFIIKQTDSDEYFYDQYLIKILRILILEKLTSKELYQILISSSAHKNTSATYFERCLMQIT